MAYRIFRAALSSILARILLSKNLDAVRNKMARVEATAQKLSVLLFVEIAVLYATQDAVRKALIYNLLLDIIFIINLIVIAIEARSWKAELLKLTETWMKPSWVLKIEGQKNFLFEAILYPVLFGINAIYLCLKWVYGWISQFEVGKKVSSEIFKKRLEDAAGQTISTDQSVPSNYRELFLTKKISKETRVSLTRTPLNQCISNIKSWLTEESTDDLILLYGNYGIGKSTLLDSIEDELQSDLVIKKACVEKTLTQTSEFYSLLSDLLGENIQSSKDLEELDAKIGKTLIIIDDIQQLFLNDPNGLSAYRGLINTTSLQLENIFWCLTCNGRSFNHLKGVFGPNHLQGEHIELMSWSDAEIQDLILKRHKQSELKIQFDKIISAVHRGDILESSARIEVQFFRMLWGQSRGNPRTAQELWVTATSLAHNNKIKVSVPDFTNAKDLGQFSDETLMLFANIVKQESLTYSELRRVSNLSSSSIKQSIKQGEDGMILQRISPQRWRIHPKAQYVVHAQLSGRNLIYG